MRRIRKLLSLNTDSVRVAVLCFHLGDFSPSDSKRASRMVTKSPEVMRRASGRVLVPDAPVEGIDSEKQKSVYCNGSLTRGLFEVGLKVALQSRNHPALFLVYRRIFHAFVAAQRPRNLVPPWTSRNSEPDGGCVSWRSHALRIAALRGNVNRKMFFK